MMPQMAVSSKKSAFGAPASDRQIAAEHATQVRKVRNPRLRARDAEKQLQYTV